MDKKPSLFLILLLVSLSFSLRPLSARAETFTLQLSSGWNMFSLPIDKPITKSDLAKVCTLTSSVWHYNPTAKEYQKVSTISPSSGYWVQVESACTVTLEGNKVPIESFAKLEPGWNQIGSLLESTQFSDIKGNCNVLKGPYQYNPKTKEYEKVDTLKPESSYWLKVEALCRLSRPLEALIKSPEDNYSSSLGNSITFDNSITGGIPPYNYSWTSSIDGNIGDSQTFNKDDLTIGDHNITLIATDAIGQKVQKSITISISSSLPSSFSWKDWMTPVKDQGKCGSCWAFATVGAVEGKYNIQEQKHLNIDLSEQYLVAYRNDDIMGLVPNKEISDYVCCGAGTCTSGGPAFSCLLNSQPAQPIGDGIPTEYCYKYIGRDSSCPATCDDGSPINLWTIDSSETLPYGSSRGEIEETLVNNGPLWVALDGRFAPLSRRDEAGNVIWSCGWGELNHAVVLVGYNHEFNYWLIKNSWGVNPGDSGGGDGYLRLDYDTCRLAFIEYPKNILPPVPRPLNSCDRLINLIRAHSGEKCGDSDYDPVAVAVADINDDKIIDAADIRNVMVNYQDRVWCEKRFDTRVDLCTPCLSLKNIVASNSGKKCGDPEYDPVADVNKDKIVDELDVSLVDQNYDNPVWCLNKLRNNDHRQCNKSSHRIAPRILSPYYNYGYSSGESIFFSATADYCQPAVSGCVYSWTSDRDGYLGDLRKFIKSGLSLGEHTITLEVTDQTDGWGIVSIKIYIVKYSSFSWKDWMTPVKDQGRCGSCWAFATAGAIEGKYNIQEQKHLNIDLSEQYLVDEYNRTGPFHCCATGDCQGADEAAFNCVVKGNVSPGDGLPTESCHTYKASDYTEYYTEGEWPNEITKRTTYACPATCDDGSPINLWTIDGYESLPDGSSWGKIEETLIDNGPLWVAINADFWFYIWPTHWDETGRNQIALCNRPVIPDYPTWQPLPLLPSNASGTSGVANHSVVLVGYNHELNYWLVKNSWGVFDDYFLGHDGYLRLDRPSCPLTLIQYPKKVLPPGPVGPGVFCSSLLNLVPSHFSNGCGDPRYDSVADINKNKIVDIADLLLVSQNNTDEAWCKDKLNDKTNPCACDNLLSLIQALFRKSCTDPQYDPVADVNKDKTIDALDTSLVGANGNITWCQSKLNDKTSPCTPPPVSGHSCDDLLNLIALHLSQKCGDLDYDPVADVNKDKIIDVADTLTVSPNYTNETWCKNKLNDKTNPCTCEDLLNLIKAHFNKKCGDSNYSPIADVNKDKIINILDTSLVGANNNITWCQTKLNDKTNPCK